MEQHHLLLPLSFFIVFRANVCRSPAKTGIFHRPFFSFAKKGEGLSLGLLCRELSRDINPDCLTRHFLEKNGRENRRKRKEKKERKKQDRINRKYFFFVFE